MSGELHWLKLYGGFDRTQVVDLTVSEEGWLILGESYESS